jgi:hypothetical protein
MVMQVLPVSESCVSWWLMLDTLARGIDPTGHSWRLYVDEELLLTASREALGIERLQRASRKDNR